MTVISYPVITVMALKGLGSYVRDQVAVMAEYVMFNLYIMCNLT